MYLAAANSSKVPSWQSAQPRSPGELQQRNLPLRGLPCHQPADARLLIACWARRRLPASVNSRS